MKKHSKIFIVIISMVLVFAILFVAWLNYVPTKIRYRSEFMTDNTAISWSNPREAVGVSNYVFVAYLEEIYDYNTAKFTRDFPALIDYNGTVYTECKVKVVSNIKGCLEVGKEFSFYQWGGINWLRTCYILDDDYKLPEVGKYYIFLGSCSADGTMIGGGSNRTIQLEEGIDSTNFEQSEIYQKYIDAYKNQITTHAKAYNYLCTADVNYGDGTHNAEIFAAYLDWNEEKGNDIDKDYYKALKEGNPKIE